jgi:hypothetical protein
VHQCNAHGAVSLLQQHREMGGRAARVLEEMHRLDPGESKASHRN